MKSIYSFLALTMVIVSSSFAQNSGTATKAPTTTGTNRQQELYDQYHGVTKKTTTAPSGNAPAPAATPAQPDRQNNSYSTQTTTAANRPQRISADGSPAGVRIGVRGGVTYLFFTEKQPLLKSAVDFVGGLTFNFGAGAVSFQPEINYARYSVKTDILGTSFKGADDVVEVPLLLKIASGSYLGNRFFVNVGPYASYVASESINGQKVSLDGEKGRFGFGAALGVGAALKAGPGHVTVEARGLYALGDTDNGFETDSKIIRSQLTLGYSFPLGGR